MAKKSGPKKVVEIGGRRIEISSADSDMFSGGLTKGDLVDFYEAVSEVMIGHLRDRPLTVQRFPRGIGARGFLQKQAPGHTPAWIERVAVPKQGGGSVEYALCQSVADIIYFANQRAITFHVPSARRDRLEYPDQLIFDFDPSDDDFEKVRQSAGVVGELLDDIGLRGYLKTSGSRGLHIIAPIVRELHIDDVRAFAKQMCRHLAQVHSGLVTIEMKKKDRGKRVFLDYLRNSFSATMVAPYSVRPLAGAPVSTPLTWDELSDPALHAQRYDTRAVLARLGKRLDPWHDIGDHARSLKDAKRRFESRYG